MHRRLLLLLVPIVLWLSATAWAQEPVLPEPLGSPPAGAQPSDNGPDTAPILAADASWAGTVVIVIVGLFVAAAVIGPIVRAEADSLPPTFSHHEDPTHHTGREPDPAEGSVE